MAIRTRSLATEHEGPYRVKSDSGPSGPPLFKKKTIVGPDLSPRSIKYIANKDYTAAFADGSFHNLCQRSELAYLVANDPAFRQFVENEIPAQYAVNRAIESALSYGDILLAVTIKEAPQTFELIVRFFNRLGEFLFDIFRQFRKLQFKKLADSLADGWLEFRYGWRPLVLEAKTLHNFMFGREPQVPGLHSAKGSTRLLREASFAGTINVADFPLASFDYFVTLKSGAKKASMNFSSTEDSRNHSTVSKLGLDLNSVLSTAYELIPLSFVLDMFVNLGDFIATYDFKNDVASFNESILTTLEVNLTVSSNTSETNLLGFTRRCDGITSVNDYSYRRLLAALYSFISPNGEINYDQLDILDWTGDIITVRPFNLSPQLYVEKFGEVDVHFGDIVSSAHPDVILDTGYIVDNYYELRGYRSLLCETRRYWYVYENELYYHDQLVAFEGDPNKLGVPFNAELDHSLAENLFNQHFYYSDELNTYVGRLIDGRFSNFYTDYVLGCQDIGVRLGSHYYYQDSGGGLIHKNEDTWDSYINSSDYHIVPDREFFNKPFVGYDDPPPKPLIVNDFPASIFYREPSVPYSYELVPSRKLSQGQYLDILALAKKLLPLLREKK
jgi:hypothetical protein